jgi:hypothetical protein
MEAVLLDEKLVERLQSFSGETMEDKIIYLARETMAAKLKECNERISDYEFRYGMSFKNFNMAWDRDGIPDKHSYQVESDFIEWEALEMEKQYWLSLRGSFPACALCRTGPQTSLCGNGRGDCHLRVR